MNSAELHVRLERYVALRRALGFPMLAEERLLQTFVIFIEESGSDGPIRAQAAVDWACSTGERCGPAARSRRLGVARGFLEHLRASAPETEIPSRHLFRGAPRPAPHIYSETEIRVLMEGALALRPRDGLRPHTIATLIGLLVSTGLRPGEAIRLAVSDVDLKSDPPCLQVLRTKFRKSRIVPLHSTSAAALQHYAERRHRLGYDGLCDRFFMSDRGGPISYQAAAWSFVALARRLGIRSSTGERGPSLRHLRHTFAVRRLIAWYREGEDLHARMPELSVYLGHAKPEATYWYLTATPRLLDLAAQRFEALAASGPVP